MITFTLIVLASKDNDQVSGLAALIRNAVMITSILGTGGNRPLYVGLLSGRRLSLLLGSGWVGSGGILRHILCKYADLHHAHISAYISTLKKQMHEKQETFIMANVFLFNYLCSIVKPSLIS